VDHLGDKPSSGMVGVLAALTLCRHVDLYGFNSVDYYNRSAWSHYYDHERPKPGREKVPSPANSGREPTVFEGYEQRVSE
jgi:hypothetical protein